MMDADARLLISKATTNLLINHQFFASKLLKMGMIESDTVPTMACDGKRIWYSAEFVKSKPLPELVAILAHEVSHITFLHHTRQGNKDHMLWNVAGDFAINSILIKCGFTMPNDCLYDPQFDNMAAEEIYSILLKSATKVYGQGGDDPGGMGTFKVPAGGKDALAEAEQEVKIDNVLSASAAKQAGKLPAAIEKYVETLTKPEINCWDILREFTEVITNTDYSWQRPNKRYMHTGMYLPSLYNRKLGEVVVVNDSSGSIDVDLYAKFISKEQDILDELQPEGLRVIQCDAAVHDDVLYTPGDQISNKVIGQGGTAFQPAFDYIEEQGYSPLCVVYFTDMDASDLRNLRDPGYPVLWMSYGTQEATFGIHVKINREEE